MSHLHAPRETPGSSIERLLKVEDVAELFGICHKSVYRKVQSGEIPAIRVGRAIRFQPDAIRAFTSA